MKIKGSATPMAENVNLVAESPQFVEYEEDRFINLDKIFDLVVSGNQPYFTLSEYGVPKMIEMDYLDNFKRLVGKTDED